MRRFGGGALANSLSQTSTIRGASRLWNCTHSETVSMLACVELSLLELLREFGRVEGHGDPAALGARLTRRSAMPLQPV